MERNECAETCTVQKSAIEKGTAEREYGRMQSKKWGAMDERVQVRDYLKYADWSSFGLLSAALESGKGVSCTSDRLPPQPLADYIFRRAWCRAFEGMTGATVQKVAVQRLVFAGFDEVRERLLTATRPLLHGEYAKKCTRLRKALGCDKEMGYGWFQTVQTPDGITVTIPRIHEKYMARFVEGFPLTLEHARRLLVRILLDRGFENASFSLLSDSRMPDLCSDCLLEFNGNFYEMSKVLGWTPRHRPISPVA
jgi:hypothetical protein